MRIRRSLPKKRKNPVVNILASLAFLLCAAFCAALAWQTLENRLLEKPEVAEPAQTTGQPPAMAEEPPGESAPETSGETQPNPQPPASVEPAGVSEGEAESPEKPLADPSFFDDALFIGDSISTGIPGYHIADNAAVVAFTGINTDSINYKEVIETPEGRITMLEAAKRKAPRGKVYIMLGGNGLDFGKEAFIAGYRTFVQSIQEAFPRAVIYLQSMTPVTRGVNQFYKNENINNERIREYNGAIEELANSLGARYLNVYDVLADEEGYLPEEASPTDGMHFAPEYYYRWFDYLRENAAEEKQ